MHGASHALRSSRVGQVSTIEVSAARPRDKLQSTQPIDERYNRASKLGCETPSSAQLRLGPMLCIATIRFSQWWRFQ